MTTKTKASRAKLERTLIALESFTTASDYNEVTTAEERSNLRKAHQLIQAIESRLYNEMPAR